MRRVAGAELLAHPVEQPVVEQLAEDLELARFATRQEGIDFSPEGGASVAAALALAEQGAIGPDDRVVIFNTGAGWLYREVT